MDYVVRVVRDFQSKEMKSNERIISPNTREIAVIDSRAPALCGAWENVFIDNGLAPKFRIDEFPIIKR